MPSVTIQGAGSVIATLTAGTNFAVARQASAVISAAINSGAAMTTVTAGGVAPAPASSGALLVVNTTNPTNVAFSAAYSSVILADSPAPVTLTGGGAAAEAIILGTGTAQLNTGGGTGTVAGGDGDKQINLGATTGFAVYTGAGHDTIDLSRSLIGGRSTVEAGAGTNVIVQATGAISQAGNTVILGAGATQVRSTGYDSVTAGAGSATIQVVGLVQDTVTGGAGAVTFVNSLGSSQVNQPSLTPSGTIPPPPTGSATVFGGAGGGNFGGGSGGSNLLVGGAGAVTLRGAGNGDVLIALGTAAGQEQYLSAGSGNETLLGSLSTTSNLFVAGSGNDLIVGGSGSDTFVAGSGSATITSGSGADLIMINALSGAGAQLTLTDFAPGVDHIHLLNYSGSNTPTALAAAATSLGSAGSRVTLSDGTTITFQGVSSVTSGFFS